MTGKTHDAAGLTALLLLIAYSPSLPEMTLATAVTAFGANFVGSLFPDVDQPTSDLWDNFRWGNVVGRYVPKLLGGHRHISHSLVGILLIGSLSAILLKGLSAIILIDMYIVWVCFMIGVVSHIIFDMPTKEGVPLFWPIMWKIGIPPLRAIRIRSGFFIENMLIFPGLLLLNAYILYVHYGTFLELLHSLKK